MFNIDLFYILNTYFIFYTYINKLYDVFYIFYILNHLICKTILEIFNFFEEMGEPSLGRLSFQRFWCYVFSSSVTVLPFMKKRCKNYFINFFLFVPTFFDCNVIIHINIVFLFLKYCSTNGIM